MSSFFSRNKSGASSAASSIKSKKTPTMTRGDETRPGTKDVMLSPPEGAVPTKKWTYDEAQLKQIEELKAYTKTLLLPESDPYHPWEFRFLLDPGTHPRYMRAAKWKMEDAKKRIKGTIDWRREFKPELIEPGDVGVEAETGKIILCGFDKDVRPIIYMRPGRENTETSPRQIRHLIFNLSREESLWPNAEDIASERSILCLLVKSKSASSSIRQRRACPFLGIFGTMPESDTSSEEMEYDERGSKAELESETRAKHINHYVERLGRGIVVNMSWLVNAFFSGISPFMDPITRDKIRFNPILTELVDAPHLDTEFGGEYNLEYDYATYWPKLTSFCHIAPDGTRVNDQGTPCIPPSGNGIKAAIAGLLPHKDAVASGHTTTDPDQASLPPSHLASIAGKSINGTSEKTSAGASVDTEKGVLANGTTGLEDKTANLAVSDTVNGVEGGSSIPAQVTEPGKPDGDLVFDHPPSEAEKEIARRSMDLRGV